MAVCVLDALSPLGAEFCRALGDEAVPVSEEDADFLQSEQVFRLLLRVQPTAVINTAEYSDIRRAESEPDACFAVNAITVKRIAEACRILRCPLLHISSDHVFGAQAGSDRPYRETDTTCPTSVFGHSKRAGELYAAECHRHFIIRTSALFGRGGRPDDHSRFVEGLVREARSAAVVSAPNDHFCTPSYLPHVAKAALHLLKSTENFGLYHIVHSNVTTWYEFVKDLFYHLQLNVRVEPFARLAQVGESSYPWPGACILDAAKYRSTGGPQLPTWQAALAEYLAAGNGPIGSGPARSPP